MKITFKTPEGARCMILKNDIEPIGVKIKDIVTDKNDENLMVLLNNKSMNQGFIVTIGNEDRCVYYRDFIAGLSEAGIDIMEADITLLTGLGIKSSAEIRHLLKVGFEEYKELARNFKLNEYCSDERLTGVLTRNYKLGIPRFLFNKVVLACRESKLPTDDFINMAILEGLRKEKDICDLVYISLRKELEHKLSTSNSFNYCGCTINYDNYVINDLNSRDIAIAFFNSDEVRVGQMDIDLIKVFQQEVL